MSKCVFEGVGTALITPFHEDGTVNYKKLEELTDRQVKLGANAIIACGTTGEKSTLRHDEHVKVIDVIIQTVSHRIPVVAGTGSNDTEYTVELSHAAEKVGADALLMVTPYYNKTSQHGLIGHYNYIADRVKLPIILYNVPSRTGMNIQPETYAALCKHPNIVATKEANGDFSALARTIALCGDELDIYSGNDDQAVALMAMGGKGVISVASNIVPDIVADMCKKALSGNLKGAMAIQNRYLDFMNAMFKDVNPIPVKAAMNMLGMDVGQCRLPLCDPTDSVKAVIADALRSVNLL